MLDGLESEQMCKPTVAPFHNQTHPQSCTTGGSNQIKYQSHCISRSDKEHKQARKPRSYASPKLRPTHLLTH